MDRIDAGLKRIELAIDGDGHPRSNPGVLLPHSRSRRESCGGLAEQVRHADVAGDEVLHEALLEEAELASG